MNTKSCATITEGTRFRGTTDKNHAIVKTVNTIELIDY